MKRIVLNTKTAMPIIGLGTHQVQGYEQVHTILRTAIKAGYRSIDTASSYRNEEDIGRSLKTLLPEFGLERSDMFLTSKLSPRDQGFEQCRGACLKSLSLLDTEYLDLFLIHWPGTRKWKPEDARHPENRKQSWLAMEQLYREGKCKALGVSNYTLAHMTELLRLCTIKPAVLQIEFHPHLVQKELVEFCRDNDIHFQAYSSLGSLAHHDKLLTEPAVVEVAARHHKSAAQVLLRWAVQQGIGVLPKSRNCDRVEENLDIFALELSEEEMDRLTDLDRQQHYCWNPERVT